MNPYRILINVLALMISCITNCDREIDNTSRMGHSTHKEIDDNVKL